MQVKKPLRILIIDDNPAIHQDFIKILKTNRQDKFDNELSNLDNLIFGDSKTVASFPNFEIDTATQGLEGVEKIAVALEEGNPYALAFVDIRMPPGWDGIETIKHIWALDKSMQVVICTAYSDYSWEETVNQLGQTDNLLVLKKPFDNIAVRQLACALTRKWQLLQENSQYTASLEMRVMERTESLNESLSLMRATLESSADGVLVIGMNGEIHDYNKKLLEMWKIPPAIIEANDFSPLLEYLKDNIENVDDFEMTISNLKLKPDLTTINIVNLKNGHIFEYYTQPYRLNNEIKGRVWSFRNISERAELERELQYQATHDVLTGLPNRVLLVDRIRQAIARADRNSTNFGVLFLDLDRFKLVNDSLSHEVGDEVLRLVTRRLQSVIREEDTLVRLGGDEFVIVVNDVTEENLMEVVKQILAVFANSFTVLEHELTLTTSIGVCIYPYDGKTIEVLLRNADTAMYHAKELGSNQAQFYTEELNRKILARLENETELRQALIRSEFYLLYQPQFDLNSEKLVSVEALIRWKHPTKGIILPINFIPLAEETGLIIPIGEWVMRTACKQAREWQKKGLPAIRVAVNITTKQFRLFNIVTLIKKVLEDCDLDPKYLELELTENIILSNIDIVENIYELKKMGVQIVLDDFGSGYSSLNYLREIPVDRIKIDQSYVQNIDSNRGDDVIIQAIIAMAKNLHLEVLAEGVETQRQLDFLKKEKCGEVQGFYFSKPLSVSDCEKLMVDAHAATPVK